jgi:hypothetical protein
MYYNARWYDPVLGRFAQVDSIIPQNQGVQAWDRYAYVNNNPVRYTDPSGHCIGLITCFLTAVGALPDYQGIANVVLWTKTDNAVVAAGIAVQSEFPTGIMFGGAHGLAQVTEDQKELYGVEGKNLYNPSVAVEAMGERISLALDACKNCKSDTDNLILAAIAQNNGISVKDISFLPIKDGHIDWIEVLNNRGGNTTDPIARVRQDITGMNYNTKFMLKLFMNDLEVLINLGYELPEEFDDADFNIINNYIVPPSAPVGRHPR